MILNEQTRTEFSAMLLKEYGIELSRRNELLPILFLMHAYEEKMGSTIAAGFGFMDAAGTQLTNSSLKLEKLMEEIRDEFKSSHQVNIDNQSNINNNSNENLSAGKSILETKFPILVLSILVVQTLLLVFIIFRG